MTARACLSSPKICWNSVKCNPEFQINFDVENQNGCLEIANWKQENSRLISCTSTSLFLCNNKISSISILYGFEKERFHLNWDSKTGKTLQDGHGKGKFLCQEMDSFELDRYLEFLARDKRQMVWNATLDIELSYYPFFLEMIRCFVRTENDAKNFADPPDPNRILKTFERNPETYGFGSFKEESITLKSIHALMQIKVTAPKENPEQRKYEIDLKLHLDPNERNREDKKTVDDLHAIFIASDYSNMYNELDSKRKSIENFKRELISQQKPKINQELESFHNNRTIKWCENKSEINATEEESQSNFYSLQSPYFPNLQHSFKESSLALFHNKLTGDEKGLLEVALQTESNLSTSEHNLHSFLIRRIPLRRGTEIELEILKQTVSTPKNRKDLINSVRDGIDQKMIPANKWNGYREDFKSEAYQNAILSVMVHLSEIFKSANPITILRSAIYDLLPKIQAMKENKSSLSETEIAKLRNNALFEEGWKLYLQMGIGNCGEHAQTCFHAFKTLMQKSSKTDYASLIKNVIYTGHRFVDHAFLVGGFDLEEARYSRTIPKGAYWNIETINASLKKRNKLDDSFVVDAYMQDVRSMNLDQFLSHLTKQARDDDERNNIKFARFQAQYPANFPKLVTDP